MSGQIQLEPGPTTAIWNSDGVRLRSQREADPSTTGAHIKPVSGSSYFTYVKVTNIGLDPIGGCPCSKTGAWTAATSFIDTFPAPIFPILSPDGLTRLVAVGTTQFQLVPSSPANAAAIGGPWPLRGQPAVGSQNGINSFWAWSPDGQFFAVVVRDLTATGAGGSWTLSVYATRPYTRGDGIKLVPSGFIYNRGPQNATALNVIAGSNLGWNAASTCLVLSPPPQPGQTLTDVYLTLVCPYADAVSNMAPTWNVGPTSPAATGLTGWKYVHSPCGHLFGRVPLPDPNPTVYPTGMQLQLIDIRRTLTDVQQRVDNLPVGAVSVDRTTSSTAPATLNTTSPGRRGIVLTHMSLPAIDNPECASNQAATVNVRRVRVTTNPNQIDYTNIGQAAVGVWPGHPIWVEFPKLQWVNPSGSTPGQAHYCLQAMGDASPGDPAPGWGNANLSDRHFAQRNIVFV